MQLGGRDILIPRNAVAAHWLPSLLSSMSVSVSSDNKLVVVAVVGETIIIVVGDIVAQHCISFERAAAYDRPIDCYSIPSDRSRLGPIGSIPGAIAIAMAHDCYNSAPIQSRDLKCVPPIWHMGAARRAAICSTIGDREEPATDRQWPLSRC